MGNLIRDVLAYSQLREQQDEFEPVDLNKVMDELKVDFELMIEQKSAVIESEKLPVIQGIPLQITQLFGNLLSNALKYSRPDVKTIIKITVTKMVAKQVAKYPALEANRQYINIEFRDNGIGFKQEYAERILKYFSACTVN